MKCYISNLCNMATQCVMMPKETTTVSLAQLHNWILLTHIYVTESCSTASDNGLSPIRHQAIIWTNAGLLSTVPLGTIFSEISMKKQNFSFTKVHLKYRLRNDSHFVQGRWFKWKPKPNSPQGLEILTHDAGYHSVFIPTWHWHHFLWSYQLNVGMFDAYMCH